MFLDQQILEFLVAKRKLTNKQANQLLAASEGRSLEMLLVERGMLDKQSLLGIKSMLCDLKPVDLSSIHIDVQVVRLLPSSMSRKFSAVVYGLQEDKLLVALANPTDPFARYFIGMRTNREIDCRVAYLGDVQALQDRAYPVDEPDSGALQGLASAPAPVPRGQQQGVMQEAATSSGSRRVDLPKEQQTDKIVNMPSSHLLGRPHNPAASRAPQGPASEAPAERARPGAAAVSPVDPNERQRSIERLDAELLQRRRARESGRLDRVRETGRLDSETGSSEGKRGSTGQLPGVEPSRKRETGRLEVRERLPEPEPFTPDLQLEAVRRQRVESEGKSAPNLEVSPTSRLGLLKTGDTARLSAAASAPVAEPPPAAPAAEPPPAAPPPDPPVPAPTAAKPADPRLTPVPRTPETRKPATPLRDLVQAQAKAESSSNVTKRWPQDQVEEARKAVEAATAAAAQAPAPKADPPGPTPDPPAAKATPAPKAAPAAPPPKPAPPPARSADPPARSAAPAPAPAPPPKAAPEAQKLEDEIELIWVEDAAPPPRPAPPVAMSPRIELLDILSEMATSVAESGRMSYVVPQVLRTARLLTGADSAAFLMCESDRRYITYHAMDGAKHQTEQFAVPFDEDTVPGWCVINERGLSLKSLRQDPRFNCDAAEKAGLPTGATACVPVRWGVEVLGALVVASASEGTLDLRPLLTLTTPLAAAVRTRQMEASINDIRMETVQALLDWNEAGAPGARQHGSEVAQIATTMARYIALPPSEVDEIFHAALLHDVGLLSPQTRDQPDHPNRAGQILQRVRILQKMLPLVRYHHERYDGKGYPHGLKGEAIPLGARVLAIAEAYCEEGLQKVARDAPELEFFLTRFGTEFDPTLKAAFIRAVNLENAKP